jgi:hypothetical protein
VAVVMVVKCGETDHPPKNSLEIYSRQPHFQAAGPLRWVILGLSTTDFAANGRCVHPLTPMTNLEG